MVVGVGIDSKVGLTPQDNAKLTVLNNLSASWFLNLNNKLAEVGNFGLLSGNFRNYHQNLTGKLGEQLTDKPGEVVVPKILPDSADGNRIHLEYQKNVSPDSPGEGKSSPSSRESPAVTFDSSPIEGSADEKSDRGDRKLSPSSTIWPAWWTARNPSPSNLLSKNSIESPNRASIPMLVHAPPRSHEDQPQPLDFSVSTKNPTNKHSFKSSSSSSAGSDDDEEMGHPSSSLGSPGPLRDENVIN
ncbi:hypothetical protein Phum_PHUM349040 [Pediculus humanus corporis]|uniref:Uncharacterized protein n=1 Tax=Pediculus humanus subsp. corporis TaxID=121224 RepID=E0VP07_PEDHC|nr:uncharacterized protein Phum_PHUM349040 [Pediculus humanus corporis]EEB15113.1 hypothetical protein Phum_PHUM349040 [Pediculus humanus corporis]